MKNIPLTIKETQKGLMNKDFSAVDLVDAYLSKIKSKNPKLNAFLTVTEERAYKDAKRVDSLIENGDMDLFKKYPLLGVVVSHKDIFMTKGIRTTAGSKVLESYVPAYSATIVKKIQRAGSILIGKLNMDAWAHGSSGENSDFGDTKNPWNGEKVPGGSSSGSAAAMASNMSLITTGTDTGGSVRLPANFCGVYGLKPTYGVVSRYGAIAMASSLDSVGSFGRCVDDIEVVHNVMRGGDGIDSTVAKDTLSEEKQKMTIGVPKEFYGEGIEKKVQEKTLEAVEIYKKLGFKIKEVSLPLTKYANSAYYIIMPAEVSSNLGRFDGIRFGNKRNSFGDEAKRRIMLGTHVLSAGYYDAYYLKAMKVRSKIIRNYDEVFKGVDLLISPVSPTPAFGLGEKTNDPLKMYMGDILTVSANLVGIPALSIPFGETKDGLPLGFQLMGPRFSEKIIFDTAKKFEELTNYKPKVA